MSSWVTPDYIKKLEAAAVVALSDRFVEPTIRQEADNALLSFRRSFPSYNDCRILLENTKQDVVHYQAGVALKDAVVTSWLYTKDAERTAVQDFTMTYVLGHLEMPHYVTDVMTQAIACMIKLGSVGKKDGNCREQIHEFLKNLILRGNPRQQMVACYVISHLMAEFAINKQSNNMGITIESHWECKKQFEKYDLKLIYSLTLEVVRLILSMEIPRDKIMGNLLLKLMKILEDVLTWTFANIKAFTKRNLLSISTDYFEPPADWENIILNFDNIRTIFAIHKVCRTNEAICGHSMSCLARISDLRGLILRTDEKKCEFLTIFVRQFLLDHQNERFLQCEVLGVANICRNLINNFKVEVWCKTSLMEELFRDFILGLTNITCTVLHGSVEEENLQDDSLLHCSAFERLLDGWTTLASTVGESDIVISSANKIFEHYVKSHIVQPEGWRPLVDINEVPELDEDDKQLFSSQLVSIAALARLCLNKSLPAIISLLQNRATMLEGDLEKLPKSALLGERHMDNLFEDLHWLIMIASFILADSSTGETPLMSKKIISFSMSQSSHIDEKLTLQLLGSPENYHHLVVNYPPRTFDLSIQVVAVILRLCFVSQEAAKVNLHGHISPEILTDLLFFLQHWSNTYVFFDENYYDEISPVISAACGHNSDGGNWCVGFIVNFACSVLRSWCSEITVLDAAALLLSSLAKNSRLCALVAKSEIFWQFGHEFCAGDENFRNHSPEVQQKLVTTFVRVGTTGMMKYDEKCWHMTIDLVGKRYEAAKGAIISKNEINSIAVNEFSLLLDLFCGIAIASDPSNTLLIFNFLSPVLSDGAKIIDSGIKRIIITLLSLFSYVAHGQICYLIESKCRLLYEWTLDALISYATLSKNVFIRDDDEETFEDLQIIFELLTHLLDRDFIDFSEEDTEIVERADKVDVSEVVLYGLNCVFPSVDKALLSYPDLCYQFYKLLNFLCELYPKKLNVLPQHVYMGVMKLLNEGLHDRGTEICKLCLEAILSLFTSLIDIQSIIDDNAGYRDEDLAPVWAQFVRPVFNVVLMYAGDAEYLQTSSETFYAIFRVNSEHVLRLFKNIVEMVSDPSHKERLSSQFGKLTPHSNRPYSRDEKKNFIKTFQDIIFEVRGLLWKK